MWQTAAAIGGRPSTTWPNVGSGPGPWAARSDWRSTAPPASSTPGRGSSTCSTPARSARSARSWAATVPADGIVAGSGLIDGRPVMVGAEDFTTLAGTIAAGSNAKRYRLAELALRDRVPLVMMLEGAGFRPTERKPRAQPDGPADAGPVFGTCPGRDRRASDPQQGTARSIAPMSDFMRHDRAGRHLHRRAAGRAGVHRRRGDQGGARRTRGRRRPAGSSTTWPRTTMPRWHSSAVTCRTSRPARGRIRPSADGDDAGRPQAYPELTRHHPPGQPSGLRHAPA